MTDLKVRILGTGTSQGIPVIGCQCRVCRSIDPRDKRLRCAALITAGDTTVLIDAGPDFRQQMLQAGADDLDAILISHEHNDHLGGLDDIRPINFLRNKQIPLYTDQRVIGAIRRRFAYIFDPDYDYPGKPRIKLVEHGAKPFDIDGLTCTPVSVMHGDLPIWAYRFGNFCYMTDVKTVPSEELTKLDGLDVLVVNALQLRPHPTHFNLEEALAFIETVSPGKTYLTHLSHWLGTHQELEAKLPATIQPAYDGLEFEASV